MSDLRGHKIIIIIETIPKIRSVILLQVVVLDNQRPSRATKMVGLGARDSIADMSKLIHHHHGDDYDCTDTTDVMIVNDGISNNSNNNAPHEPGSSSRVGLRRSTPSARRSGGSWTCPSRNESFDSLISFDNDSSSGVAGTDNTESVDIVHEEMVTILNDGIAAQEASTIPQDRQPR